MNSCETDRLSAETLLTMPLWQSQHLGQPIPDSPHAVSVCLPRWQDNIAYEEGDARVCDRLQSGYPRFVFHPICRELFAEARRNFAADGEDSIVFGSQAAAVRCASYIAVSSGRTPRVDSCGIHNAYAVTFAKDDAPLAKAAWQHGGEGIGSRHAAACLAKSQVDDGQQAREAIRTRIASLAAVPARQVTLHTTGMSAFFAVYRTLMRCQPDRKTVQFGFPYIDALKIQEQFGPGTQFYPRGDIDDLRALERLLGTGKVAGVFTEFPSNPLLQCPDLAQLSKLARRYDVPLVVDDTLSGFANVDLLPVADVLVSSLTKLFSGVGDVTGGSVVVNPQSPFASDFTKEMHEAESLWGEDAVVLEQNSRNYVERVRKVAAHAEELAEWLCGHPAVSAVHYPKLSSQPSYDAFRKPAGGYGNLLSIDLKAGSRNAPQVFDALQVCKGPNLGTDYTLACPYTLLAHYRELDVVEQFGVSRWLIRISVGLEPPADMIERFRSALAHAS